MTKEDINKLNQNPILKTLKEGDVVMCELGSIIGGETQRQIIRLKNLKFQPKDADFGYDWLDFEGDVLFTSLRTHRSNTNFMLTNCLGITEVLNDFLVGRYRKTYMLFKPDEHQLSDEEFERNKIRLNSLIS